MTETPLSTYLQTCSQIVLAKRVGCHQTAISRMFRVKRPIFVVTHDNGEVELIERKFKKLPADELQKSA